MFSYSVASLSAYEEISYTDELIFCGRFLERGIVRDEVVAGLQADCGQ